MEKFDLLYLAHGREVFTYTSLYELVRNTNWSRVHRFYLYTDGAAAPDLAHPVFDADPGAIIRAELIPRLTLNPHRHGGPVAVMLDYLSSTISDYSPSYFVKIDNDLVLPPAWLDRCADALERSPIKIDLLGIEPTEEQDNGSHRLRRFERRGYTTIPATEDDDPPAGTVYGFDRARHIGGIGLMRRGAFYDCEPMKPARGGRFGFTEWQWENEQVSKAFLNPPIKCFLLDHLPFPPWGELSEAYVAAGLQRQPWGDYPAECEVLWLWWVERHSHAGGAFRKWIGDMRTIRDGLERKIYCSHDRLNEDGICRACGADRRSR